VRSLQLGWASGRGEGETRGILWKICERLIDANDRYSRAAIDKVKVDHVFAWLALAAPGTGEALALARSATSRKDAMESTSADARSDPTNTGIYSGYTARKAETRRNAADYEVALGALGRAEFATDLGNFTVIGPEAATKHLASKPKVYRFRITF
jgi:hypothetical protein